MSEEIDAVLQEPLVVINLGLKGFADSLEQQEIEVVHIDWTPPAGGDREMIELLEKLL